MTDVFPGWDSILLLITFLMSSPFSKGHHGCSKGYRGPGGRMSLTVYMAPESCTGSQVSLGRMKLVLTAVPSSRTAWLRSDLSIAGSVQAEARVSILTLGTGLSLRLFFSR